ncbi:MAG: hypothetical protein FJ026_09135 [Chloroflexi bacterium]|nr:hypothetical protein [Chloroflexota bacterium]
MINEIRLSSHHSVLLLDAGGTLLGQWLAQQSDGQVIVEAMNAMGYDAMTVGGMDLQMGVELALQRAKEARFAFLSCNIVRLQDNSPIFTPYVILERNGTRFGILGLSDPEAVAWPGVNEVARVMDPAPSVRKYLPEVRSQSDVVIVLSHIGLEGDIALAQAVPGIDVIVGGKSQRLLFEPERAGETIIVQAGYDGEWLGRLDVTFDASGKPVGPKVEIIALGPEVGDDPDLLALVTSYKQRFPLPTPASN